MPKRDNLLHPEAGKKEIAKNEDVEFSMQSSDNDDIEAMLRAEQADRRQENKEK